MCRALNGREILLELALKLLRVETQPVRIASLVRAALEVFFAKVSKLNS